MSQDSNGQNDLVAGDTLKHQLRKAGRRRKSIAIMLLIPVLSYLVVLFLVPIGSMLWRSVANPTIVNYMPHTVAVLKEWEPTSLPSEQAYAAVNHDLRNARRNHHFGQIAKRLNEEAPGMFSLIAKTSFQLTKVSHGPWKPALVRIDSRWGDLSTWRLLKRESTPITADFYLAALDLRYNSQGHITREAPHSRIYVPLLLRTLWMSGAIMLLALLLGFPLAYWLSKMSTHKANIVLIAVLIPFWTSLLVRTIAWITLLQSHGVINNILVWAHVIADDQRLKLIYNQLGTVIVMTQILLPFMILPLYSVMKGIPGDYQRAAISLGSRPTYAFWRIYAPLTLPGVASGCLLVFILSIGYYITPALVGGRTGQFLSNMIAYNVQESLNWGLASALGVILIIVALIFYAVYSRIGGIGVKLK